MELIETKLNIQEGGLESRFTRPSRPPAPARCVNDLFQFCAVAVHTIALYLVIIVISCGHDMESAHERLVINLLNSIKVVHVSLEMFIEVRPHHNKCFQPLGKRIVLGDAGS